MSALSDSRIFFDRGVKKITPNVLLDVLKKRDASDKEKQAAIGYLKRNKRLSILIAESYLPGGEEIRQILTGDQDGIKKLLVEKGVIEQEDADHSRFDVDRDPPGPVFAGSVKEDKNPSTHVKMIFEIPFPERSEQLTDEQINSWLATSADSEPWEPYEFSEYIPYTC